MAQAPKAFIGSSMTQRSQLPLRLLRLVWFAIGLAVSCPLPVGAVPQFDNGTDISADTFQYASGAFGDFDGDGNPDLVASVGNGNVLFYKGAVGGALATATNVTVDNPAYREVASGDIDQDGDLDLVGGNCVTAFANKNNGDGSFAPSETVGAIVNCVYGIDLGDLDGDGDLDLVTGFTSQPVKMFFNNGAGVFGPVVDLDANSTAADVKLADVDNDGDLDLIVVKYQDIFRIYKNDGSGAFDSGTAASAGGINAPQIVAIGDLDQDGDLDIVLSADNGEHRVYLNNGVGEFTLSATLVNSNSFSFRASALGDANNDGFLDFAGSDTDGSLKSYFPSTGAGIFAADEHMGVDSNGVSELFFGDLTNDGKLDAIVLGTGGVGTKLFQNTGSTANAAPTVPVLTAEPDLSQVSTKFIVRLSWAASTDAITTDSDGLTYVLRIGTTPGGRDILSDIRPVGPGPIASASAILSLSAGTYYWSVKAVDPGYLSSSFAVEDSFTLTVDTTAPAVGSIVDNGAFQNDAENISASWSGFTDAVGVTAYSFSAGTAPGLDDVVAVTSTTNTSINEPFFPVDEGTTIYVNVQARDAAGNWSSVVSTNGVTVDLTPPGGAITVQDEGAVTSASAQLSASWTTFTDALDAVAEYSYSIGVAAGGEQALSWSSAGTNTHVVATGLSLAQGETYFLNIRAKDSAGNISGVSSSNGILVDTTAPSAVTVTDDGQYTTNDAQLSVSWTASTDAESNVTAYSASIQDTNGATVSQSTLTGTSLTFTGLNLTNGGVYTVKVQAQNGAGIFGTVATSNGITVDTTAPAAVTNLTDAGATQTNATTLTASWTAAAETQSSITAYSASVIAANGTILSQSTFALATSVTFTGLALNVGTTYYIQVQAVNSVNLTSSVALTDGIEIVEPPDTTPPSAVTNLTDAGATQTATTNLTASWTAATDNVGVTQYIATLLHGTDTVSQSAVTTTSITFTNLNLTVGETYTIRVVAQDAAENQGPAVDTDGIQILAPPEPEVALVGDLDDDSEITRGDVLIANKIAASKWIPTARQLQLGDVAEPKDGKITTEDANLILRCAMGTIRGNPAYPWCPAIAREASQGETP